MFNTGKKNLKDEQKQEFYYCTVCKNLMIKLNDSGLTPVCCAKSMVKLDESEIEGTPEKHKPTCEKVDNKLMVKVGDLTHPMTDEHYIEWIFVKTDKGIHGQFLAPADVPKACFKLCEDERIQGVYSYCNIHGLWKAGDECAM